MASHLMAGGQFFCASWIQLQRWPVWLATLHSRLFIRSRAKSVAVQLSREKMVSPVETAGATHVCSAWINLSVGDAVRLHWSKSRRQHRKHFVVIAAMKFPSQRRVLAACMRRHCELQSSR